MKGDEFFMKVAGQPPFSRMHPKIASFFKEYLSNEKVVQFQDRFVVNTHFPPYPSRAFENMVEHFDAIGEARERSLFSVTLAVTNKCMYHCWHCYNAGRSQKDVSLDSLRDVSATLQDLGAVHVTLTGGEPLIRGELEDIAASFDARTYLSLNTTGAGLTRERASALRESGVFALGVSLDSMDPNEHDRLRGKEGAFRTAVAALGLASDAGLYAYVIAVATRAFLEPRHFWEYIEFASERGAREVHLLEPCATGKLAGHSEVVLSPSDRQRILDYQKEIATSEDLPIFSSFLYLESPDAFGCGAGLTHLYIDGGGEVCPCNLIPLSFGNVTREPLPIILEKMGRHFRKPRCSCVGQILSKHTHGDRMPLSLKESEEICERYLPKEHPIPRFFQVRGEAIEAVGLTELQTAYDEIHTYYDDYWVSEAGKPVEELLKKTPLEGISTVVEGGCGTGFATALIAGRLPRAATVTAIDLSEGMLAGARKRIEAQGISNVSFVAGDALEFLGLSEPVDLVLSTWVLGYIPLNPFFNAASRALRKRGFLMFVVHKYNSPREPLEIFGQLVAEDPSALQKRVDFDFPKDMEHIRQELSSAGLGVDQIWEGSIVFRCSTPREALEHLLKSGAGTAYFNAVDPAKRGLLLDQFVARLGARRKPPETYDVIHDYISCVARKK